MFGRWIAFVFVLCTAMFSSSGWAQGGLVAADTGVRYTPVAFPQLVQLANFSPVNISLRGSNGNGGGLTFVLVTGPSLGSLGALDPIAGTVSYTPPADFSASDSFTFLVTDGVLSSEVATVSVFAPQPAANLSAPSLDLGSSLSGIKSPVKFVILSNPSVAALMINSIAVTGSNVADFAIENTGTCPRTGSLAAGANCSLGVSFTPLATGVRSAALTITDNAFDSPQLVAVTGTGTDFFFAAANGGSTSATVTAGQTATYKLQVSGSNGFAGLITLGCSGIPLRSTCNISPSQVSISGGPMAFTVSVVTTAETTAQMTSHPLSNLDRYLAICMFGGFALVGLLSFARIPQQRRRTILAATTLSCALLLASCGGGTIPSPPVQQGTPPGTYTLTVSGAVNGATRTTSLTLVVQ